MQSLYEHRITITTSLSSSNLPNAPPVLQTIEKITRHVRAFGKFFRRLQQLETKKFVLLPICTDIVLYYWSKVVQSTEVSPELINGTPWQITPSYCSLKVLQIPHMPCSRFECLSRLWFFSARALRNGPPYGGMVPPTRMVFPSRVLLRQELNVHAVLPRDFVEGAVRLLVTRFIPLTPKDLEKWEMDVEEWMNQEENEDEQWEYELRVCVYFLYPLFTADYLFCIAVCGACAVNFIYAVQRLCYSYPVSVLRQRCRCVDPCLTPGVKLMSLQHNRPWSYPTFSPRKQFTVLSAGAHTH